MKRVVRGLGVGVNAGLFLLGLAVGGFSIVLLALSGRPELSPRDLLYGGCGLAFLLLLLGSLGIMASSRMAGSGNIRSAWQCYIALAIICTLLAAVGVQFARTHESETFTKQHFDKLWQTLPDDVVMNLQQYGQCCGFANGTDRVQEPCQRYRERVGCFTVMENYYLDQLYKIIPTAWTVLGLCLMGLTSGALLWLAQELEDRRESAKAGTAMNTGTQSAYEQNPYCAKQQDDPPGTPKLQQTYDAWHRTIFK